MVSFDPYMDTGFNRRAVSAEISRLQSIRAKLDLEMDNELTGHLDGKIQELKRNIIESKPLQQQIASLEGAIERKLAKAKQLEEQWDILNKERKELEQHISEQNHALNDLKRKQIETLKVPDSPPPTSKEDSSYFAMMQMAAAMQGMIGALNSASAQGQISLPEGVAEAMAAAQTVIPIAPVTPLVIQSSPVPVMPASLFAGIPAPATPAPLSPLPVLPENFRSVPATSAAVRSSPYAGDGKENEQPSRAAATETADDAKGEIQVEHPFLGEECKDNTKE